MSKFRSLVLYHGYSSFQFGLFSQNVCIAHDQTERSASCSEFLPRLTKLFEKTKLSLDDLDACAVYTGPGAFTALRVTLSFANGFAFARKIPLVGVTGFEALHEQVSIAAEDKYLVQALKAFGEELYLHIQDPTGKTLIQTCIDSKQADTVLNIIPKSSPSYFVGNGIPLLLEHLGSSYIRQNSTNILDLTPMPSLESIAIIGEKKYNTNAYTDNLQPMYLKNPPEHP